MSDKEEKTEDPEPETKRKRGRPPKPKPEQPEEPKPKRPRGRPLGSKKKPEEPIQPKRPRGRPRKATRPRGRPPSKRGTDEDSDLDYDSAPQSSASTRAEIKHQILLRIDEMRMELTQMKQLVNKL